MKTKRLLSFFLLLTFSIIHTTSSIAEVRYVSKTGSSTPPYTSWETAADSIQKAIDASWINDTIIVANGTYYESIYVNRTIHLIGSSMDSTIINSAGTTDIYCIYFFENNSTMKNFKFISPASDKVGVYTTSSNLKAEYCAINVPNSPLSIGFSSVNISNFIMRVYSWGVIDECPSGPCNSVYSDNIIISSIISIETAVWFFFGGNPTFTNNIVIAEGNTQKGVSASYNLGIKIKNNLVSGYNNMNIGVGEITTDFAYIENNISLKSPVAYGMGTAHRTIIRNNIAKDAGEGFLTYDGTVIPDYNLFWNVDELVSGTAILGDSNIVADPMFVKDTIPNSPLDFDYHLQAYSPAIDKGYPNIMDKDGTRSDIGMYGGPLGETYSYQDLAPLTPRNVSALVDSNQILLKWNKNTEADTSHYIVYRDTVVNFTIDPTKLVSSPTDTFFIQLPPYNSSKLVYKITCVDNQGNESKPSEAVVVDLTTSSNEYPIVVNDYLLYQNYPNPFNPSTMIGYKLKERGYVKLMVYDIKGELVSVLVNKEQSAGYYEVEFNGSNLINQIHTGDLASGIYLYRIEVIGEGRIPVYTEMKKMLMIK